MSTVSYGFATLLFMQQGRNALKAGEGVAELVLELNVGKAIFNFGKMIKNNVFSETTEVLEVELEELSESSVEVGLDVASEFTEITVETVGEDIAVAASEAAIETAATSSLAATGIGILAAIGVDVIFGAIDGAREEHQLNEQLGKLRDAEVKSKKFLDTVNDKHAMLNNGVLTEMQRFIDLVDALKCISSDLI